MSEELKPCPFCGDNASIDRIGTSRVSMQISCDNCGCHFESGETWIDDNSSWNKRVTDRLQQDNAGLREHLANLVKESIALAQFKNDTLRKGICSTDLDEPEWHDYQTIGEAGAYLAKLNQEGEG